MDDLDEKYSTTRLLTKEKPKVIDQPEDNFETFLFSPESENRISEGGLRTKGYFKKSYDDKPLVTIITVVFNGEKYLEETIQSVINQSYDNVEYIIIDGGSTDGTVDIIKKYEGQIDYWISEKDRGIGDAWNKGVRVSLGSFIMLVNADDKLYNNDSLEDIVVGKHLKNDVIMYGDTQFINENGTCAGYANRTFDPDKLQYGFGFMHTSCIVPKDLYKKVGLFSTDVRIAVDTQWLVRAVVKHISFEKIKYVNIMRTGGISDENKVFAYYEYLNILLHYKIIKKTFFFKLVFRLRMLLFPFRHYKIQLNYIRVRFLNFIINNVPFFILKNTLLKYFMNAEIGAKSYIHGKIRFFGLKKIVVKNNSTINFGCYLDNRNEIHIGNNVSIGHNVKIYTLGHDINDPCFNTKGGPVVIDDNVCIFPNVLIMPNVHIGEGAVIYPGSVVTKNIPAFEVYGGNPAKKISERNKEINYKIDYGFWFAN